VRKQRELQAILALCRPDSVAVNHLVQVFEVIRESDSKLYFVCEFMPDGDLKDFLATYKRKATVVNSETLKSILHQVLHGLQYIHSHGFIHRDIKPENLLMSGKRCKVADFSLARLASTVTTGPMTTYVSSRWYRAPELVLESQDYTTGVDMFALGCVMGEIITLEPLFPGRHEYDQLPSIMGLLGPLHSSDWPEGVTMVEKLRLTNLGNPARDVEEMPIPLRLANKLNITDAETISLLAGLLKLNPSHRLTAESALRQSFFADRFPGPHETNREPPFDHTDPSTAVVRLTPKKHLPMSVSPTTGNPYRRFPVVSVSPKARETTPTYNNVDTGRVPIGKDACRGMPPPTREDVIGSALRPCQAFGID